MGAATEDHRAGPADRRRHDPPGLRRPRPRRADERGLVLRRHGYPARRASANPAACAQVCAAKWAALYAAITIHHATFACAAKRAVALTDVSWNVRRMARRGAHWAIGLQSIHLGAIDSLSAGRMEHAAHRQRAGFATGDAATRA